MKTSTGIKFDRVIQEGFQAVLKPMGFRKKANNFYLQLPELGQIISIQKSQSSLKDHIRFTINTGLFIPEYWSAFYNYQDKGIPTYLTELECAIRLRIGRLRHQQDTWYDIQGKTDETALIATMKDDLVAFILPYFDNVKQSSLS